MRFKAVWILLWLCHLGGCAAPPNNDPETSASSQPAQINNAQRLSQGQDVTISTSQGEIDVEPALVSVVSEKGTVVTDTPNYNDPWEGFNRAMFSFNHGAYKYVLIPVADGYKWVLPEVARDKVGNFFDNIREPLNFLNNLLAGELSEAGQNVGRFVINSTIGLLGLFDPATTLFDIKPQQQSIGQTLASYGVESGPFLVLPILGQSDVRGGFSVLTEGFIHPINQVFPPPESYQLRITDGIDDFSNQSETYQTLYDEADDPYLYFRNQYMQGQRRDFIYDTKQQETHD